MKPACDVSVVIVNYHSKDVLAPCLDHLRRAEFQGGIELLVVDNSPGDGAAELLAERYPEVRVLGTGANLGFGPACNLAFAEARGHYVLLVNPDAFVPPEAIGSSVAYFREHPKVGVLGVRLTAEDGGWHPSARNFPSLLDKIVVLAGLSSRFPKNRFFGRLDHTWWDHASPRKVDWVVGAYFMIRADLLRQLGGFDPRFFIYFEEMEFCKRVAAAGSEVHFVPCAEVRHVGGVSSSGKHMDPAAIEGKQITHFRLFSEALYYGKYHGRLGAATMLGVEWLWTSLRQLRNRFGGGPERRAKYAALALFARKIRFALRETAWGTVVPPQPWSAKLDDYPNWKRS